MMEEDQQQRFVCRFCNKSFWSGSALGGHMRGHIALISAEKVEEIDNGDLDFELEGAKRGINVSIVSEIELDDHGEDSYGLGGNPKKSWRVSDSKHAGWKKLGNFCEECGKGFSSLKALTIHMRLHMAKRRKEEISVCKECGKEFESIKGLFGHMRCHPKRSRAFVESDYQIVSPIRKKRSRTRYYKVSSSSCSDLNVPLVTACSETDEVKDVALCLMMLSRGLRSWDEFKLIFGSLGCTDSGNLEGQLLIESKGNPGNEGDVNFACDNDGEIRHMEAIENLDFGVSVSQTSANLDSEAVNDDWRKPKFEASVDKYSVGIKNEASSELEIKAQVGDDKEDQGMEKTNLMREVVLVDQNLNSNENSCNDSSIHVPVKPVPLRVFVRKNRFKCSACSMIFFSHQAVVDHEATHKTVDSCIQLTEEESGKKSNEASLLLNIEVDSKLEKLESNAISVEQVVIQRYACSICFKVFKSGPALGGHKRAHYNRRNESKDKDNLDQELPDHMHNLLGLNFPATLVADMTMDAGLKPCRWPVTTLECEPPVIFN